MIPLSHDEIDERNATSRSLKRHEAHEFLTGNEIPYHNCSFQLSTLLVICINPPLSWCKEKAMKIDKSKLDLDFETIF